MGTQHQPVGLTQRVLVVLGTIALLMWLFRPAAFKRAVRDEIVENSSNSFHEVEVENIEQEHIVMNETTSTVVRERRWGGISGGEACSQGPYLYYHACGTLGGVGSRLSFLKVGIGLEIGLQLKHVALPDACWRVGHDVNVKEMRSFFAWHKGTTCSWRDLPTDFSDHNVTQTKNMRIIVLPLVTRAAYRQLELYPKKSGFTTFVNGIRESSTEEEMQRTVFVALDGGNFPTHGHREVSSCVREQYSKELMLKKRYEPPKEVEGELRVGVHIRRGDITEETFPDRFRSFQWWNSVLTNVIHSFENQSLCANILIFSEGEKSTFEEELLSKLPPETKRVSYSLFLGNASTIWRDLDVLSHTHVLIGGRSSFFRVAAQLASTPVVVMMNTFVYQPEFRSSISKTARIIGISDDGVFERETLQKTLEKYRYRKRSDLSELQSRDPLSTQSACTW